MATATKIRLRSPTVAGMAAQYRPRVVVAKATAIQTPSAKDVSNALHATALPKSTDARVEDEAIRYVSCCVSDQPFVIASEYEYTNDARQANVDFCYDDTVLVSFTPSLV